VVADRTFRPSTVLIGVLAAAAVSWLGVLALLLNLRGVEGHTYLAVFFFIGFFGVFLVYYSTQAIVGHSSGLVVRRFYGLKSFEFHDILKIEVYPGPAMTIYDVCTRRGPIQFSSWFPGHKELLDLLIREASLEASQKA
jgi:hypothetical protein